MGKLLVDDLLKHIPNLKLDIASRRPNQFRCLRDNVNSIQLDIYNRDIAIYLFSLYDLVIFTIGPFDILKNYPHSLCVEAGTDCLDINDSFEATRDILQLNRNAFDRSVMIMTGMGLVPGLSTLLLLSVLTRAPSGRKKAGVRLFIGAKYEVGFASLWTVLSNFKPWVMEIFNGNLHSVKTEWSDPEGGYVFPQSKNAVKLLPYPSPEAWTIQRSRFVDMSEISRLNLRLHLQSMPHFLPKVFSKFGCLRTPSLLKILSNIILKFHNIMTNMPGTVSLSTVVAECETNHRRLRSYVTGPSSYHLTASFASAITEMLLAGRLKRLVGVCTFEDCFQDEESFEYFLKKRSVFIHHDSFPINSRKMRRGD